MESEHANSNEEFLLYYGRVSRSVGNTGNESMKSHGRMTPLSFCECKMNGRVRVIVAPSRLNQSLSRKRLSRKMVELVGLGSIRVSQIEDRKQLAE